MPTISDIPTAAALQTQLANLNTAIAALSVDGTTVPNIVVMPGTDPNAPPGTFIIAIGLALDPPIQDPTTLAQLQQALQDQANTVSNQLVNMGFTDDGGQVVRQGPAPQRAASLPPTPNAAPLEENAPVEELSEATA